MVRRAPARGVGLNLRIVAPAPDAVARPVADRHRRLLPRPARSSRCSGRWTARRRGSAACAGPTPRAARDDADRPRRPAARRHEDQPHRHVDRRGRRALQGDGAAARAPADRSRLPLDRLLAVHPSGRRRARTPASGRWAGSGKTECGLHVSTPAPSIAMLDERRGHQARAAGSSAASCRGARRRHRRASAHDSQVLLKFHGIYQQDDRDVRRERASQKLPLDYSCMVRASVPGGKLTAEQWLALDRLAELADGTMRLTTRQGVQFHVVHKGELHELVEGINRAAADDARRVRRRRAQHRWARRGPTSARPSLEPLVASIVARFRPQTESYWELWVDGEKACTAAPPPLPLQGPLGRKRSAEPIYGDVYLPRKFKIAVAWPGDNNVDVLANDVGLVPTLSDGLTGDVTGYNVYVGGEHGHEPRPRGRHLPAPGRAARLGRARARRRRRRGRRHRAARLRQPRRPPAGPPQVHDRGARHRRASATRSRRRARVEIPPLAEQVPWSDEDYHGTRDGVVGLPVPSGKVADRDGVDLRTAMRELVADGLVTKITRHRPPGPPAARHPRRSHRPRRGSAAAARRQAGRRRQRAAPPVDRLPGPADVRPGAGRGRAGAARPRRPSWRRRSPTPATATRRSGST